MNKWLHNLCPFYGVQIKKKEEGFYRDGQLEGLLTVWGEDGQMQYAENYKEGMLHGLLTMYSVNGGWVHRTENYKEGKLDGLVQTFYEGGGSENEIRIQSGAKD